jgi:hypothetical protein
MSSKDSDKGCSRKARKREEKRTGIGNKGHGVVVVVRDTDRRRARDCGRRRRDTGEVVDEDSEPCVVLREQVALELFPEAEDEDRVGILPWEYKCQWRWTGAWRANKSLMIVVSASLSRTPFGRTWFRTGDGVTDGGGCCSGQKALEFSGKIARPGQVYSQGAWALPPGTEHLEAASRAY